MHFSPGAVGSRRMRIRSCELYGCVLVALALSMGAVPRSFAEEITPTGEYTGQGLVVGNWKFFPSLFVGAVYDDNFNQSATGTNHSSGVNLRVSPRLTASYDASGDSGEGIHKITPYVIVDARAFDANNISASAGLIYTYEAMRDLIFTSYGNYTRQTDIFNSALNFNNNAIGLPASPNTNIPLIVNPFGTTPGVNPIAYNQFTGGGAVTKTFDQAFVGLSATAFDIVYDHSDNIPQPFHTSHDGASFWFSGRVGYNFPQFYVFAQGDYILQRFSNSLFDTNGYRVIGGVGRNDPGGLFRGEVYGGYQFQHQEQQFVPFTGISVVPVSIPQDTNTGVFGGRLSYYPTEYWTIIAQVDEVLGMSTQ